MYQERVFLHRLFVGFTDVVFSLILVLLGLRFLFRLFNASTTAPFTKWLYTTTADLIYPFRGIFPSPVVSNGAVLDVTTLVAIIMYALLFALIVYLFDVLFVVKR